MMDQMKQLYESNKEVHDYVDRYAKTNGISVDTAMTHRIVQLYANDKASK